MYAISHTTKKLLLLRNLTESKRKRKEMWVRKIYKERKSKGEFHHLIKEMMLYDHELFFKYFRMSPTKYEDLLRKVAPRIEKCSDKREPIGPSERLSVTLRYLFTGDAQATIAASFRISPASIGRIINETANVLWEVLAPEYILCPSSEHEWRHIAGEFERKWQFNHCVGAIDGKHIVMQVPSRAGSSFFNYKKTHSIVLMAVCDANYKFTMVDIGDSGRNSDGGIFSSCNLGIAIMENRLNLPNSEQIWGSEFSFPYVFVGDEAFPLRVNLMKPYPRSLLAIAERIFCYRLSRCRRIIENTFGILASRFRIFRRPIIARLEVVIAVTKASVALHNFLMHGKEFRSSFQYCPPELVDQETARGTRPGTWRNMGEPGGLVPLQGRVGSNNYSQEARVVRENFRDFFYKGKGQVPWQLQYVTSVHNSFD